MMKWEDFLKKRLAASPEEAAAYLRVTLAESGPAAFALALRRVIEARGGLADLPLSAPELAAMLEALEANVRQAA
jgi:DNA-binding phage protein